MAAITCVPVEITWFPSLKAQLNLERLVSPPSRRQLYIFAASSPRSCWGNRCSLENGAERYTPHSNSIEPPILPIGWMRSRLRAADWTLKMHSRMISQPTTVFQQRVKLTLYVPHRFLQKSLESLHPQTCSIFYMKWITRWLITTMHYK